MKKIKKLLLIMACCALAVTTVSSYTINDHYTDGDITIYGHIDSPEKGN